jgi:hypothetical protein
MVTHLLQEEEQPAMKHFRILRTVLGLTLCALVAMPGIGSAEGLIKSAVQSAIARQWQVKNDNTVKANTPYELHNTDRRQLDLNSQLGYTKDVRTLASDRTDVGWVGHSGGLFEFRRPNIRDHRTVSPFENLRSGSAKSDSGIGG